MHAHLPLHVLSTGNIALLVAAVGGGGLLDCGFWSHYRALTGLTAAFGRIA